MMPSLLHTYDMTTDINDRLAQLIVLDIYLIHTIEAFTRDQLRESTVSF